MNPDELDIARQQEAAIPPVNAPPPPTRQEVMEDPQQIFRRVLSYLYIEEAFITSILNVQRIRNFRVAVILTGEQRSFPPTTDTIDIMGGMNSGNSAFVKKSLKTFENSKFPSVPVTVKAMKEFRINMKNQMRSMDLDHLVNVSYVPPSNEGEPGYEKYRIDAKFFFSAVVEILSNLNHPTRSWLMTEELENDGRGAYFKLISHYDNETIEDSFV